MRRENTSFLAPHTIHLLYTSLLSLSLHTTSIEHRWEKHEWIFLQDGGLVRLLFSFSYFFFIVCGEKWKTSLQKEEKSFKIFTFFCKRYTQPCNGIRCKLDEISKETDWKECVRMKIFVHWKIFVSFREREKIHANKTWG